MNYFGEIIALSIDGLVFFVCLKQYLKSKRIADELQRAPVYEINPELEKKVLLTIDKKIPYAVVRGQVKAIGPPIDSSGAEGVTGVIQKITFREHVVSKGAHGFWNDSKRIIQETNNSVPFVLMGKSEETTIEVMDAATHAEMLELTTIADKFQPTESSGIVEHVWGYFTGIHRRGLQTTEEMLREGSIVTGAGEITFNTDGSGSTNAIDDIKYAVNVPLSNGKTPSFLSSDHLKSTTDTVLNVSDSHVNLKFCASDLQAQPSLRLHQPVKGGLPLIISHLPLPSLITRLEGKRKAFGWATAVLGLTGVIISCWIAYKWVYAKRKKLEMEERRMRRDLERRKRRRLARAADTKTDGAKKDQNDELEEAQLCVACRENPKELILMPCGHVCLCEDCFQSINNKCPICRADVDSVNVAYIA